MTRKVLVYSLQNPWIPDSTGYPFDVRHPPANPPDPRGAASSSVISRLGVEESVSAAVNPAHPPPMITTRLGDGIGGVMGGASSVATSA
mmetsp:Transcript_21533/g.21897  ORF Transcript_21533/g.21897 Transcript_21533/m.21897 type:complete len:89 (+) Transcript_21533:1124-1390(+)